MRIGTGRVETSLTWRRALAWSAVVVAALMAAHYALPGLRTATATAFELCAGLLLLVLFQLWGVAASHQRGIARERQLRQAAAALAAAGTVEEVAAVVRDAGVALARGAARGRAPVPEGVDPAGPDAPAGDSLGVAALSVRDGDRLREVPPAGVARPGRAGDYWLPFLGGTGPRWVSAADLRLPDRAGRDGAMLCPLRLTDRPSGDPLIGLITVFGGRRALSDQAATLEILAGQTALAVERIMLSQEVVRRRGEALFRTLVQDASDVILIVDDADRVRYATPSASGIFGEDVAVEGTPLTELVAPGTRDEIARELAGMRAGTAGYEGTWRIKRRDGRSATLQVHGSDRRADQTVRGLVLTLRDVTEQRQLEDELKHRAFHDALTGLPNRVLFADRAARALSRSRLAGQTAGVLFVDLDDFKVVNDTMGHAVGDELLVAVGARLSSVVRASDTAARLGGDEFALLIEDAADADAVLAFAERIVAAFEAPFALSEATVLSAATVGVATTDDSADVDELLRHADLALYAAKAAGKRRWRRYQPVLSAGMIRRREVQAALDEAVRDSAFVLAYQPIVGLASGEIAGFEALVRWPHPRWGMLLPGQFIELAEETGHIVPLGAWVLRQALADMVRWRARLPGLASPDDTAGDPGPYISVNVSARQFRDPGFVPSVRSALAESGLPPSALVLELTESALLGQDERVHAELAELKESGVRLAIDDFGTGYSSLGYLLELPMDVLKIDKTFVTGINSSRRRLALVEGIVRIARTLDLQVTAEGIETETQRELLATAGCQCGQGYLLSVPVDAAEAEGLLRLGRGLVPELPRQQREYPDARYLRS